jgi:hypothetical protein
MEIQPIEKQEAPEERMKRETEPAQEVRDEHHTLPRIRGGDDLPWGGSTALYVLRDVPRASLLCDLRCLDLGGHPLATNGLAFHYREEEVKEQMGNGCARDGGWKQRLEGV